MSLFPSIIEFYFGETPIKIGSMVQKLFRNLVTGENKFAKGKSLMTLYLKIIDVSDKLLRLNNIIINSILTHVVCDFILTGVIVLLGLIGTFIHHNSSLKRQVMLRVSTSSLYS